MRRTVMLEILSGKLENLLSQISSGELSSIEAASIILSQCEEYGMQPPEVSCPVLFRKENRWEDG